jgi:hypothetical protein
MQANHVSSDYPDQFGNYAIASGQAVSVGAVSNIAAVMGTTGTSFIVRRITVANANKSLATANVSIITTSDGNTSNAVASTTQLSNVTSTSTFQDLTLAAGAATTVYSAGALFVKVTTAVSGGTCDVTVYGDIVNL